MSEREDHIGRVNAVAEMLGLSPEQLLAAALNAGAVNAVKELDEEATQAPPPIIYPNVKFAKYKFREYPKMVYGNGRFEDIEETITKIIPREGGGVDQRTFVRVIPDQFRYDTRLLQSKVEENTLAAGWYFTLGEAKEAARVAKANSRPIVERPVRGRPRKAAAERDDEGEDANPMAEHAAA